MASRRRQFRSVMRRATLMNSEPHRAHWTGLATSLLESVFAQKLAVAVLASSRKSSSK